MSHYAIQANKRSYRKRYSVLLLLSTLIHLGGLILYFVWIPTKPQPSTDASTVTVRLAPQPSPEFEENPDQVQPDEQEETPTEAPPKEEQHLPMDNSDIVASDNQTNPDAVELIAGGAKEPKPNTESQSDAEPQATNETRTTNSSSPSHTDKTSSLAPTLGEIADAKLSEAESSAQATDSANDSVLGSELTIKTDQNSEQPEVTIAKTTAPSNNKINEDFANPAPPSSKEVKTSESTGQSEASDNKLATSENLNQQTSAPIEDVSSITDGVTLDEDVAGALKSEKPELDEPSQEPLNLELPSDFLNRFGNLELLTDSSLSDSFVEQPFSEKKSKQIEMVNRYLARMNRQVRAVWVNPYRGGRMYRGVVLVEVSPKGYLQDVRVHRSSGLSALDSSVVDAIKAVNRFEVPEDEAIAARYYSQMSFHYSSIEEKTELMPFQQTLSSTNKDS